MATDHIEHTPTGHARRIRRTVRGNLYGYEGSRRVVEFNGRGIDEFSPAEKKASAAWLAGREDWYDAAWED